MNRNQSTVRRQPTQKRYILFTMSSCGQCNVLKSRIGNQITSGLITEYDLNRTSNIPNVMTLFNRVSPNRSVPALAIMNGNQLENAVIGTSSIMRFL